MKILLLCNKFIYPPRDGGAIASFYTAKALAAQGHQLTIMVMNTPKHFFPPHQLPEEVQKMAKWIIVPVDTRIKILPALYHLLMNRSYHIARFISTAYNDTLIELLHQESFEVVMLEGLALSLYVETIRTFSDAPIIMRAHNVEHQIWQQLAQQQKNKFKKIYLSLLAKQLRSYEIQRLNKYDILICFTEEDYQIFQALGCTIPIHVIPPPLAESFLPSPKTEKHLTPALFYIGALDWLPNLEGLCWFVENVWIHIHKKYPHISFYIAGRNMQKEKPPLALWRNMNIILEGEVANAYTFMQDKPIMVVPLFSGSGIRIKIIEGMALGKTIIATPHAIKGIPCKHGQNILVADTAQTFVEHIEKCLNDKITCKIIGDNAMHFARREYSSQLFLSRFMSLVPVHTAEQ